MKTLIAYFSHEGENIANSELVVLEKGNTEKLAEKIAALTGGDLYRIIEAVPYPRDYMSCNQRAKVEYDNYEKPALKDPIGPDMSQYDKVFLGFPVWYRSFPRIIATFLDKYDLTGKTVYPFCTNDEEFFGLSLWELEGVLHGGNVKEGLVVRGVNVDTCDEQVKKYIDNH
ncbi:MAG: flavodoxin [Erysipelotrichaceae bacterium]|nr:flavodoxin [Erysipelotrichaceae bacterium]